MKRFYPAVFTLPASGARLSEPQHVARNLGGASVDARSKHATLRVAASRSGIALVITLIMLSIITVITVAFLALSSRERSAVGQATSQTVAEMAAETGRERATAQIIARILNTGAARNALGPDLMASVADTNRILTDLQADPWVPVLVNTNKLGTTGPLDERPFLDLNRNGRFDLTGVLPYRDINGNPILDSTGQPVTGYFVGDPQWVGTLPRPDRPHSADNRFLGRYAFIILPVGKTLDINYSHNQALGQLNMTAGVNQNGYRRHQGFGTDELNLAAFLADLNTNVWIGYQYDPVPTTTIGSTGLPFDDAREILRYRYTPFGLAYTPENRNLPNAYALFGSPDPNAPTNFNADGIDAYLQAPLEPLGRSIWTNDVDGRFLTQPWPGYGSRRHFFTVHDLFLRFQPTLRGFADRLAQASAGSSSYDRYTFYRLLAQLGTDSTPEDDGKINLNYKNTDGFSATNMVPWEAYDTNDFFITAADRLLRDEYPGAGIGLKNGRRIPVFTNGSARVWVTNNLYLTNMPMYSPRVHQLLQIAANIYEATKREKQGETEPFYPTVFRPQFQVTNNADIFVTNYVVETGTSFITNVWHDLEDPVRQPSVRSVNPNDNIYNVPVIVAAKKGLPNFNEFALMSVAQVSRRLQFRKLDFDRPPVETNHMFIIGVSNQFGVEAWNSYSNNTVYRRDLQMRFAAVLQTRLENNASPRLVINNTLATNSAMALPANTWLGQQFRLPPVMHQVTLPDSVYYSTPLPRLEPYRTVNAFDTTQIPTTNDWWLTVRSKLLFFLTDNGRIVDAVSIAGLETRFDISRELSRTRSVTSGPTRRFNDDFFDITPWRNHTQGTRRQMQVSLGIDDVGSDWSSYGGQDPTYGMDKEKSIDTFRVFLGLTPLRYSTNELDPPRLIQQAPFTPIKKMYQTTTWEVNDPLVHYTAADLMDATNNSRVVSLDPKAPVSLTNTHLGTINARYRPWGRGTTLVFDTDVKDPGVFSSDYWEFPTHKYPNIGWLGRVHRGTPWQTIYLKAKPTRSWLARYGGPAWTMETHPTNDWRLMDIFTVAQHPNATRGRLSVNQTNLAAWSAVFSGVSVAKIAGDSSSGLYMKDLIIEPASKDPVLEQLVAGINRQRDRLSKRMFRRLSDFLSVPELTDESPFLRPPIVSQDAFDRKYTDESPLTDIDMERVPQQIMSLVQVGSARFVIYSWGQALQPAAPIPPIPGTLPNGLPSIDTRSGLCQNYQVTGEVATRAVVRIDGDLYANPPRARAVIESFNILPNE